MWQFWASEEEGYAKRFKTTAAIMRRCDVNKVKYRNKEKAWKDEQ